MYPSRTCCITALSLATLPALAQQKTAPHRAAAPNYEVSGQFSHAPAGTRVLLVKDGRKEQLIDSATTDANGRFRLRGSVPGPDVYTLKVPAHQGAASLALAPGSRLQVRADAAQLWRTGEVTGTPEAVILSAMNREHARVMARLEELAPQRQTADTAAQRRIQREWDATMAAFGAANMRVARSATYLAPYAVATFLSGAGSEVAFVDSATAHHARQWPASPYTKRLLQFQQMRRATAIGQLAPEAVLASPTGQRIALSSLRGKYVLVDFWASWCKPCRQESPHLVQLYKHYQPKGFDVYGVSVDAEKANWTKAIAQDGLPGTQVLDDPDEKSVATNRFDVVQYPTTYLLDREGRIIAKNLSGEALERKLAELLP